MSHLKKEHILTKNLGDSDADDDDDDGDNEDDEFTSSLEQVGKFILPSFSIWPHLPSLITYDPRRIAKRLSETASYYLPQRGNVEEILISKKDGFKNLCVDMSEFFTKVVNSAVDYPIEDFLKIHDNSMVPNEEEKDPSGVKQIHQPKCSKLSLVNDRLASYDHLTYITFDQFKDADFLRTRIRMILDLDISPIDRRFLIQKLMSRTYHEREKFQSSSERKSVDSDSEESSSETEDDEVVVLSDEAIRPSYFDAAKGILGCKHYQTNCKLECPICRKWFACPFCHDEVIKSHKLPRKLTTHFLCMYCNTPQNPSQFCVHCNREFGRYYCDKCKLVDNDPMKHIYHCDKCGICRLGLGLNKDYFHCDKCNACISIALKERHVCVENSTHSNCPICDEYMFNSNKTVVLMACGHPIHQACFDEYTKHSYKCPLCSKTIVNMESQFRILDKEIDKTVMPGELRNWVAVIKCIDCEGRSKVPYHYLGLRCNHCGSYNTMQLKILKGDQDSSEVSNSKEPQVNDQDSFIKQSMNQNFSLMQGIDEDTNDQLSLASAESQISNDVTDSYVQNFIRVINRFEDYPSISEAFKDWMGTSMPETD